MPEHPGLSTDRNVIQRSIAGPYLCRTFVSRGRSVCASPFGYDLWVSLEVIHRRGPWRSFEAVEYATLEWVDWFNNRRLLEPIGNIPPAEAEANFYAALETEAMAA